MASFHSKPLEALFSGSLSFMWIKRRRKNINILKYNKIEENR
jgi:hypothetical protein